MITQEDKPMPVVTFPLSSTEFSVFNSIYYKIIEDVANTVEIDQNALTVLYKNLEYAKTDNEDTLSIKSSDGKPTTISKRRFVVRVNQEYDEDNLDTMATHQEEHFPIFMDHTTGVSIAPVYMQMDVELEFEYLSPSRTELGSMRDKIRMHLSRTRNIGHHEVEYTMLIPSPVEEFVADVHELRNRLIPKELDAYFLENSSKRVHLITDMVNEDNVKLGVKEKQVRIVGTYGFSPLPEKSETDNSNNSSKFSFTYKFSVTVPRHLVIRYPAMICNRLLPNKYLSFVEKARVKENHEREVGVNYIGFSNYNFSIFEANKQLGRRVNIELPINVPSFDEFKTKQGHKGYGLVMSFLLEIDETDNRSLFNLKELGDYHIATKTLNWLEVGDYENITSPYESFMYLGLHQENKFFDGPVLTVDQELNVKSKVDLDLTKPVRVTIGLSIDMSMLANKVIESLNKDPEMFLDFLNEHLEIRKSFKDKITDGTISHNFLVNSILNFILRRISVEDYETVLDVLEIVKVQDSLVLSDVISFALNNRPETVNALTNLGVKFIKQNTGYTLTTGREVKQESKGDPIYHYSKSDSATIIKSDYDY